jgi:hypothetical protein
MAPDEVLVADQQAGRGGESCPICFEVMSNATLCALPCEHEFHQECLEELRKHGVLQACPLCRAGLPDGPEKTLETIFDEALRRYCHISRSAKSGKTSWQTLTAPEKNVMKDVNFMWTSAAKQGHVGSQHYLGCVYCGGEGAAQYYKEGLYWIRKAEVKAAAQGCAETQCSLGGLHQKGEGVSQDTKEAVRWFRKAADQGLAEEQFSLSIMYAKGDGVPNDVYEGKRCLTKAADQGHLAARKIVDSWSGR